ncbi:11869_t:CDS:2 [Funneliformis caledonium]|uniref:11869_t:CDS:1 n=1 Tax=Funneliformis caledonium TaxID=1117310 RepID=A0A9N9EL95_9GLOM|nr:11869_t:CDS:2 [Funneliformis caledonium]
MPAKFTLICIIHLIIEKGITEHIVREAIIILRRETNVNLELRIITFFPKNSQVPRWIPLFSDGNILRFTGKFALSKDPYDTIEMTANAADLINIGRDNLPISSISLNITEFARSSQGRPTGRTFCIKCRYLKSDRRIEKKATRIRKNSNLMITGEMISINIESPTGKSTSSLYSWPAGQFSERISAQVMTSIASNT